ncbi:Uncharacterized protein BCF24048_04784 [Bacillus cereus]|nr:Uncharacterized protein BCF24048_04784 [Bacillus cereus]
MEVGTTDHAEVPYVRFIMYDRESNLLSTKKLPKLITYL